MNPEQLLPINGVELCVQTFGDDSDPTILLIHGASASMLWWEEELCERLAAGGRHVIRFDNRDTGRSTFSPPGAPDYAHSDLVADAVGILDALGVASAHVVGRSMSGGTALALAVDYPDRVSDRHLRDHDHRRRRDGSMPTSRRSPTTPTRTGGRLPASPRWRRTPAAHLTSTRR